MTVVEKNDYVDHMENLRYQPGISRHPVDIRAYCEIEKLIRHQVKFEGAIYKISP